MLERAKHRTKKEIARVEPLGRSFTMPRAPSWSELATPSEPAPAPEPPPARDDVPQRYSVQFTATTEYVELLERAKDLLSHTGEDKSLERVHVRALQALVALEKRR